MSRARVCGLCDGLGLTGKPISGSPSARMTGFGDASMRPTKEDDLDSVIIGSSLLCGDLWSGKRRFPSYPEHSRFADSHRSQTGFLSSHLTRRVRHVKQPVLVLLNFLIRAFSLESFLSDRRALLVIFQGCVGGGFHVKEKSRKVSSRIEM